MVIGKISSFCRHCWHWTCKAFTIEYYLAIKEEAEDDDEVPVASWCCMLRLFFWENLSKPGSWRTISCRMLQLNGFHPDFLSIKHHCQTLLFRRRKKNPRAASFVRTWQGWLEICTWVSTKTCCLDRIEYLKKNNLLFIILYAYISVSYVYTGSRAGYIYIHTWLILYRNPRWPLQ